MLTHLCTRLRLKELKASRPKWFGSSITVRIQKCLCFPAPPTPPLLPACRCWPTWPQPQYLLPRCLLLFLNLVAINHYPSLCADEIIAITFTCTLIKSCCTRASS